MNDLLKNGTIYCKNIAEFTSIQLKGIDDGRYDENEIVTRMEYAEDVQIRFQLQDEPSITFDLNASSIHIKELISKPLGNLYCLFTLEIDKSRESQDFLFDERLGKFGTHCILIKDNIEFIDRIKRKLKEDNLTYEYDKVIYKDYSTFTGEKDLFSKGLEFDYQNETRFYIQTELQEAYSFQIGSIEDIATIYPSSYRKWNISKL